MDANDLPSWLTVEMFGDLLEKNVKDFKKILKLKAKRALAPGENYVSIILRVEIDIELKDGSSRPCSFILKLANTDPVSLEMIEKHNVFDIERGMYVDIISEYEQMYRDVGFKVQFGAKHYLLDTKENYILLEDLRPDGFKNTNRLEGLDMEHIHAVLEKLAQWHAVSATRITTKGSYPDQYTRGFIREESKPMMKEMTAHLATIFMDCAKTYEGNAEYLPDLEKLQLNLTDVLFEQIENEPDEFQVLNHGDCWSNNIMFQYDAEGKVKQTLFVDYQIPRVGSPAQDLLYFIISSTKLELKINRFDYFIKFYHDHLTKYLKMLMYPKQIPTLKDLHIACLKHGIWGYFVATGVMAAVLLDSNEGASLENFVSGSEEGTNFKKLMFSNARYRKHMQVILPWLHNRGILES